MFKKSFFVVLAVIFALGASGSGNLIIAGEKSGAFLGVYLGELDDETKAKYDIKTDGALLTGVIDDGGAKEAGMKEGDLIIAFNGKSIKNNDDLRKLLKESKPGDEASVKYLRSGKENTVKVKLGEPKNIEKTIKIVSPGICYTTDKGKCISLCSESGGFLGVVLQDMSDQLEEYFGVKGGALIGEVVKESPADKIGLKAGDVVLKFDDKRVDDAEDLRYYIKKSEPKKEYPIVINRKGKEINMKVTLDEKKMDCGSCFDIQCLEGDAKEIEMKCKELMKCYSEKCKIEECDKDGKKAIKIIVKDNDDDEDDEDEGETK